MKSNCGKTWNVNTLNVYTGVQTCALPISSFAVSTPRPLRWGVYTAKLGYWHPSTTDIYIQLFLVPRTVTHLSSLTENIYKYISTCMQNGYLVIFFSWHIQDWVTVPRPRKNEEYRRRVPLAEPCDARVPTERSGS